MPNDKPANYRKIKTLKPEITSFPRAVIYWFFLFCFMLTSFTTPVILTENQLTLIKDNRALSEESVNIPQTIFGLLLSIALLWFVKRELRKWIMRLYGARRFSSGRTLSDIRFLGRKYYIPRILANYWASSWYFTRFQYMVSLIAPMVIIFVSLLIFLSFIDRSQLFFLYILFLFLYHGVLVTSDIWLFFFIAFLPSDSYIYETDSGLEVYNLESNT